MVGGEERVTEGLEEGSIGGDGLGIDGGSFDGAFGGAQKYTWARRKAAS